MTFNARQGVATARSGLCPGIFLALFAVLLPALAVPAAWAGEGYTIEIDGTAYEIGLDRPKEIDLPDGRHLRLVLSQDEYSTYKTASFSFDHKSSYKPSRTDLGSGVTQTIVVTPLGTAVLVQEYSGLDPTALVDLMLKELSRDEIAAGYSYEESEVSQVVGDRVLKGRQATTASGDEIWMRQVFAHNQGDSGLLIITMIQQEYVEEDGALLEDFWRSLEIGPGL